MSKRKRRKQRAPRSIEALTAILHCKGGPMQNRAERRSKDARRSPLREEW
jgi:hypothetical protein